jgi:plastocyanin
MQLRKLSYCALLVAALFFVACGGGKESTTEQPAPSATPSAGAPAAGGNTYDPAKATASVSGKVTFEGTAPTPAKLPMTPECLQAHGGPGFEETVTVKDGALKDVFVYVKSGAEKWTFTVPATASVLDQKGCHYEPHIVGVMAGQKLEIVNSDPFLHNVHPMPTSAGNEAFNQGMPVKGMKVDKVFNTAEMIPVKCDVHRWMSSHINVVKNPFYAVSAEDGTFTIKNLPAGTYTLEAWHEKYGTQTQSVTVTDGQSQTVTFNFKG